MSGLVLSGTSVEAATTVTIVDNHLVARLSGPVISADSVDSGELIISVYSGME